MALALAFSIHNKSNPHIIELCLCHCSMAGSTEDAKLDISPQDTSSPHFSQSCFSHSSMAGSREDAQLEISLQEEPSGGAFRRHHHFSLLKTIPYRKKQQSFKTVYTAYATGTTASIISEKLKNNTFSNLGNKKPMKNALLPEN